MSQSQKRKVEVFTAGCPACDETVALVRSLACEACNVEILDMKQPSIAERAEEYGIRAVPAVVINGTLAACCSGRGPDAEALKAAGLGRRV